MNNQKYRINDRPSLLETVPLSLQHVLVMLASTIPIPIIFGNALSWSLAEISFLIQCSIFTAGISTMIQTFGVGPVGGKLPIIMGVSFTAIAPAIAITASNDYATFLGSSMICGVILGFLGPIIIDKAKKILTPLITGTVVIMVGLALAGVSVANLAGGHGAANYGSIENYILGGLTVAIILFINRTCKGFVKTVSVLIGMSITFILSIFMKAVDISSVAEAAWFSVPQPLKYGVSFDLGAVGILFIIYVVCLIEFVGDTTATTVIVESRTPTDQELLGGVRASGFTSAISGLFNALPNISYSGNIGLLSLTGVGSRFVVGGSGVFLVLLGFCPKLSTLLSVIPNSIVGGATLIMFGLITTAGIKLVTTKPLTERDGLILALSIAVGLGFNYTPDALADYPYYVSVIISGIPGAAITAVILNLLFPKEKEGKIDEISIKKDSAEAAAK